MAIANLVSIAAMALFHMGSLFLRLTERCFFLTGVLRTMYNLPMESFQKALRDAQEELARVDELRTKLLQLIADLKALSGDELEELNPPPNYKPEGITNEIRKVLSLTPVHLTAVQIRDSLLRRGFEDSDPKTLLIAVHTILKRIENGLDSIQRNGKPAYRIKDNVFSAYEIAIANAIKNLPSKNEFWERIISNLSKNLTPIKAGNIAEQLTKLHGAVQATKKEEGK